ncbi:MAG: glycosyltransferase family 4 protein [Nanoarchaeota archaeon]
MNYLLLTEYFPASEKAEITGGIESRCFHLVKELSKEHQITVLCSHQPGQERISEVVGAKVIRCGPIMPYSSSGDIFKRLLFSCSLYQTGKKLKNKKENEIKTNTFDKANIFDIIEGSSFLAYPPAYFLGKKFNAKKVATWHETWVGQWIKNKGFFTGSFGTLWERFSLTLKWDEIIAVSEFTKHRLIKQGINEKKIRVVPNGIEPERFKHLQTLKEKVPTICFFGRLNWQKNVDVLIKALPEIEKEIPEIRCELFGSGPAEESLKALVRDLKLEQKVRFHGYVKDYNEMLKEAKKAHLFVQPSTLEGFGITVIEALALKMPYVISDIPPFIEITKNGQGGEIFQQMNVKDLAQKVIKLLTNKKDYLQKIEEGNLLVEEYDWGKIAKNYFTDNVMTNISKNVLENK